MWWVREQPIIVKFIPVQGAETMLSQDISDVNGGTAATPLTPRRGWFVLCAHRWPRKLVLAVENRIVQQSQGVLYTL